MTRTPEESPVERAVEALRPFGPMSRERAAALLDMWAHRDTLSPAEVASVLDMWVLLDPCTTVASCSG